MDTKRQKDIILDGAVDNDRWNSHKDKRILWILKEANELPLNNDLRELLNKLATMPNPNKIYNKWKSTYGLVVKVSHGLLNNFDSLGDWANTVDTVRGVLKEIAVINVNKRAGVNKINPKELREVAEEFHNKILEQIKLLDPDVVILAGTGEVLGKWLPSNDTRRKWISVLHPGQRTLTHKQYYDLIVKKINKV